jgi:dihydrofolate synthase / folylpolyglutamate synthase
MIIKTIQTRPITSGSCELVDVLDESITELPERCVVAIAAKIVALCEGRTVPMEGADKEALIRQETDFYLPSSSNPYGVTLSIARHHLVASGGIDESNGNGQYVLWPEDLQASANMVREHLCAKHKVKDIGVVITDSTTRPFQWGTTGLGIACSGFEPLKDYRGTEDIFGRTLVYHTSNIMNGLAAAAVTQMGEGDERTPLALITDIPFVKFQNRNPSREELAALLVTLDEDVYAPFLRSVPWEKGGRSQDY